MRVFLIAFLLLILPLRAWVGDAMGIAAAQTHHAGQVSAPSQVSRSEASAAPCAHAGTHASAQAGALPCPHCQASHNCVVCLGVALVPDVAGVAHPAWLYVLRPIESQPFVSALSAPTFKPPIA